jgi:hypothetical protein
MSVDTKSLQQTGPRVDATDVPLGPTGPLKPPASDIRPCTADDIPGVARLFQKTFRDSKAAAPASLEAYLRDLFVDHPARDPELPSRVYIAPDGSVGGFIGVLPLRMSLRGKPVRAAIAGSLMVDKPAENPLAGAKLFRSFLNGPQDLSMSETANPVSQGMWTRLGGKVAPAYSLEWLRVLRPAGFAVASLAEFLRPARWLMPAASLFDGLAARIKRNPLNLVSAANAATTSADVSDEDLIALIPKFLDGYTLRPDLDPDLLRWMLKHAAQKDRHGPLFRRVVYGRNKAPLGLYLYYGRPRGTAFVLQIFAKPGATDAVVDDLLAHASRHGSVAVRGRTQPELLDALMRRRSVFLHRSSTMVHTRNPDLLGAINLGEALMNGLAGESWTRLIGGLFI